MIKLTLTPDHSLAQTYQKWIKQGLRLDYYIFSIFTPLLILVGGGYNLRKIIWRGDKNMAEYIWHTLRYHHVLEYL